MATEIFTLPTNVMAITLSPPQSSVKPNYLYNDESQYLQKVFKRFSKHFILYPEFDSHGRLHYHGIFTINDKIKYFNSSLPSLKKMPRNITPQNMTYNCHVLVKPLSSFYDHLQWLTYCRKEWGITQRVLRISSPIIPKTQKQTKEVKLKPNILDFFK